MEMTRPAINGHRPPAELASDNGTGERPAGKWSEIGTLGLPSVSGYIQAAYHADLQWPGVYPLYNRLRRSDPEVSIIRQIFSAVTSRVRLEFRRPQTDIPESDDDKRALEFAQSALADMAGSPEDFLDTLVAQVPFMGWGWWEAVPGLRRQDWRPPGDDDWRSQNDDGLVGFRRLAWRDHSSFVRWDLDEATGRLNGMVQNDPPNAEVTLPLSGAIHVTFGDADNPEGLTPLEAIWRLERIKYGLEIVQGIGYEHAAGYLSVKKMEKGDTTESDKANIRNAARQILTAQEGNYANWPYGWDGEVKDIPFAAGAGLLEAIRYYGLLKLTLYNMQWVGMSVISGTGSYAALKDSSAMWLVAYNAMLAGFARQLDRQYGRRLFTMNPDAFPGMTRRPQLVVTEVEKTLDLSELSTLWSAIKDSLPLGDDDYLAFRRKTGFLPEALPEVENVTRPEDDTPPDDAGSVASAEADAEGALDAVPGEMGWRRRAFDLALARFNRAVGKGGAK